MNPASRILIAMAAAAQALAGTPAHAQEAPPADNSTDLIGPPQLRDFSINGTVTRPREDGPPATTAPPVRPPIATVTPPAQRVTEPPGARAPAPEGAEPSPQADLPPPTPADTLPPVALPPVDDVAGAADIGSVDAGPVPAPLPADDRPLRLLPWLLALVLVCVGAGALYLRQRRRAELARAAAGRDFAADLAPQPQPEARAEPEARPQPEPQRRTTVQAKTTFAPAPQQPAPTPLPAAPPTSGVVSTRLRPWLTIEFTPERAIVDEEKAVIEFSVSLFNSGSAPARDILLEGALFNAGPLQDQEIGAFFANPVAQGSRVPLIPPLQRIGVRSVVGIARNQVLPIDVEGRPLFVPLVAFNALYSWGSSGEGQTSNTFLVGKQTGSDKLGPFRLDLGPRVFRTLDAREHELRVRK